MMKQHAKHFETVAQYAAAGMRDHAIRYLQGMLRAAMSARAANEIKQEIEKYL